MNTEKTSLINEDIRTTGDLGVILAEADAEDLDILVDYITDRGNGRLTLDSAMCKILVSAKDTQTYGPTERALIAHEILEFGGNSLGNAYRKARAMFAGSFLDTVLPNAAPTVAYDEIVRDVASHLGVKMPDITAVADVEMVIVRKIMGKAVEKMTDEEKEAVAKELGLSSIPVGPGALGLMIQTARFGGFTTFKLATMVANAVAKALLGKGLTITANAALMRGVGIALGPIGWAITAIWTLADLSSPAYRVTMPAVVQVAYMRNKLIAKKTYSACRECQAVVERSDKFCSNCAAPLGEVA
ncbi:YaaW family protein [Pseudoxanthomonas sp.]|uniref:YaaW family protein n=1 Tax=Pseudoxanthomonas sp. TaxID=1871049 RepID=UPI0035AF5C6E